jgi:uncharacterized protein YydD (DUF2326 family)
MINSISSSIPTFKRLDFHTGLNILLADTTSASTEKQTRNSVGKTNLIEIIHFLLGSDADKNSLFKKPDIVNHSFTATLTIDQIQVQVTRSGSDEKKILLSEEGSELLGVAMHRDDETGIRYVSVDEWRDFLGNKWFRLPRNRAGTEFEGAYAPTFRSLVSYFVRRRKSGGYTTIEKQNANQQPWDWQVNLSYLLDLGWQTPRQIQDLRARRKTLQALRKAINDGELGAMFRTSAEIRPEMARTEERIARFKAQIGDFRVLESYRESATEVARLKAEMSELTLDLASVKETIDYLSRSIREEKPAAYADVERLYEAAGVELPGVALRRFEAVRAFQNSVIENRRKYLHQQIQDSENIKNNIESRLAVCDGRKSKLLKTLEGKGAFEDLMHLHEELARATSHAETLASQLQNASILENNVAQQKRESADLEIRLQEDHAAHEDSIKAATVKVDAAINALYDDRTGNLIITATKNGPQISIEIQGGGNQGGIDMMKIFCFDSMLFDITSERLSGTKFLVHDSHLFDGVDARQVQASINFATKLANKHSAQYIVTMNSDDFNRAGLSEDKIVNAGVLGVRLTDDEAGGLFGFRFD